MLNSLIITDTQGNEILELTKDTNELQINVLDLVYEQSVANIPMAQIILLRDFLNQLIVFTVIED